ncbi:hypothetical protein N9A45_01055 [bacterium]|nr:hypothetical protein [bacterium]
MTWFQMVHSHAFRSKPDIVVERPIHWSKHALQRRQQGRQGEIVYAQDRKKHRVVAVTVLPYGQSETPAIMKYSRKAGNKTFSYQYK